MSPALEGGFLTTVPPGKPSILITNALNSLSGNLFISTPLVVFLFFLFFCLKEIPLSSHFV